MSKKTRYFMVGAVAFLVVGLSIGTIAYYNGGFKVLKQSGPAELQFVPENAAVVAYANVQQIMNSDFRQRIKQLEGNQEQRGQQEFLNETGIDIEKDIDNVIAYMTSDPASGKTAGVVMANGRFDQTKIGGLVKEKGGTVADYHGKPFMTLMSSAHPESESGALAFLNHNQVAVGSADAVRRTVDLAVQGGSGGVTRNAKMMDLIGQVSNGNAWVVGRFDALSNHARLPQQVTSQIPPITWFSASSTIDGGVKGQVSVETTDEKSAANLRSVVEGLKGLAALQARSNNVPSQLQQILDSLQLTQGGDENRTLTIMFSVPADVLNGLAAFGKAHSTKK